MKVFAVLIVAVAVFCCPSPLFGQTETATISGRVTDPSGAAISGANVQIQSVLTGREVATKTNTSGLYVVTALQPGTYRIIVSNTGFKQIVKPDVVLNVQDNASLNFSMTVGSVLETVTVPGGAPLVNTQDAAVGTVVDRQFVANIALNGRSLQPLIELTPGVVPVVTSFDNQGQFSVNGQRSNANYFTVDGVGANVQASMGASITQSGNGSLPGLSTYGGTSSLVSLDALQEFKVLTSTFSPEYGRTPGAQVSVVTRSGTNQLHGTAFNYFRNDVLDARNWFNVEGTDKPATRQNDFGGVLGGPILKDRTFYFFSYEGLRLRQPKFATVDVPSITTRENAPASLQPYLNAFPIPNGPEDPGGLAPFSASYSQPSSLNAASIRVDHKLNEKSTLFGRYNYAPSDTLERIPSFAYGINTVQAVSSTTHTLTLGHTQMFTPTISNELRFNYSHVSGSTRNDLDDFGGAVVPPDSQLFPSFASSRSTSLFSFNLWGLASSFAVGVNAANLQRQINLVDSVSVLAGAHSLKFGADYRRLKPSISTIQYGQFAFFSDLSEIQSSQPGAGYILTDAVPREPIFTNLSLYAQDSWRVSPRLTLTYGLRWEYNPPPHEANGKEAFTVVGLDNPATMTLAPRGTELYHATHNNFAPRIGAAYQLKQSQGWETVLRGGFGLFYDLGNGQISEAYRQGSFGYGSFKFIAAAPFPFSTEDATPNPVSTALPVTDQMTVAEPNLKLAYARQWNFAIEQSLGSNQVLSATYVGAAGRRLLRDEALYVPNDDFQNFLIVVKNGATSDYSALQLQYKRRLSRGIQALASYSWSHAIDDLSLDSLNFVTPSNQTPSGGDRGSADFDVRHAFAAAITYDIPAPHAGAFGKAALQGWSLDTIVKTRSATPVDLIANYNVINGNYYSVRPDVVAGESFYLNSEQCLAVLEAACPGGKGFNPAAFVAPSGTEQGTLGRNALRGFSFFQLDTTVRRQFNLTERWNLQFRADFFNILNHPNFAAPNNYLPGTSFGRSLSTYGDGLGSGGINGGFNPLYQSGGPRSIQLSLKLQF